MNWQTKDILEAAKKSISDNGVFSDDQIASLQYMVALIAAAIAKESSCNR